MQIPNEDVVAQFEEEVLIPLAGALETQLDYLRGFEIYAFSAAINTIWTTACNRLFKRLEVPDVEHVGQPLYFDVAQRAVRKLNQVIPTDYPYRVAIVQGPGLGVAAVRCARFPTIAAATEQDIVPFIRMAKEPGPDTVEITVRDMHTLPPGTTPN